MASAQDIKRRIKSVKSTKKITKAMELVAASKMKRAVSSTLASRLYAEYSWEVLTRIAESADLNHPFFSENTETDKVLLIVVTSNRGLCGSYNTQAIKQALPFLKNMGNNVDVITVGKRGDSALRRLDTNIVGAFHDLPANISLRDILPISMLVTEEFKNKKYQKVLVVYTDFISALTQKPNTRQILPISKEDVKDLAEYLEKEKGSRDEYIFEGDENELIGRLAEKLVRMQIYQMLLESNASEQSSRMMAMKNASEASGEMIDDLTLLFNKARQANITREISEISAGMASIT